MQSNKVCIPAPHKLSVGRDVLEEAGCELVLGMDQDEYPKHLYTEDELVELVGNSDAIWAAQRDVFTGAVLARLPEAAGGDHGRHRLRDHRRGRRHRGRHPGVQQPGAGELHRGGGGRGRTHLHAVQAAGAQSAAPARRPLETERAPGQPDGGPHHRHHRPGTGGQGGRQAARALGDAAHRLRPLHHPGVGAAPGRGAGLAGHGAPGVRPRHLPYAPDRRDAPAYHHGRDQEDEAHRLPGEHLPRRCDQAGGPGAGAERRESSPAPPWTCSRKSRCPCRTLSARWTPSG